MSTETLTAPEPAVEVSAADLAWTPIAYEAAAAVGFPADLMPPFSDWPTPVIPRPADPLTPIPF